MSNADLTNRCIPIFEIVRRAYQDQGIHLYKPIAELPLLDVTNASTEAGCYLVFYQNGALKGFVCNFGFHPVLGSTAISCIKFERDELLAGLKLSLGLRPSYDVEHVAKIKPGQQTYRITSKLADFAVAPTKHHLTKDGRTWTGSTKAGATMEALSVFAVTRDWRTHYDDSRPLSPLMKIDEAWVSAFSVPGRPLTTNTRNFAYLVDDYTFTQAQGLHLRDIHEVLVTLYGYTYSVSFN